MCSISNTIRLGTILSNKRKVPCEFNACFLLTVIKCCIFTCVALAEAGLVTGPLRPSVRPSVRLSVRPQHFRGYQVCVICNSKSLYSFSFETLPYDCSHIENVHLLFCARFIFFSFLRGVDLRHYYHPKC